jgi:AcrR family transcriptional regulator
MSKGDATRLRIVEEAGRQAAVRGLGAVSLGEVADAVGVSKSGLFKHFESKEAMQLAALGRAVERFVAYVWAPGASLPPGRAVLEGVFTRWLDWGADENGAGGCLLHAASVELDDQPGPLRDFLKDQFSLWQATLARQFRDLRDPPLSAEAGYQAAFEMKALALGYVDARRLLEDPDARRRAERAFKALLERTAAAED